MQLTVLEISADAGVDDALAQIAASDGDVVAIRFVGLDGTRWRVVERDRLVSALQRFGTARQVVADVVSGTEVVETRRLGEIVDRPNVLLLEDGHAILYVPDLDADSVTTVHDGGGAALPPRPGRRGLRPVVGGGVSDAGPHVDRAAPRGPPPAAPPPAAPPPPRASSTRRAHARVEAPSQVLAEQDLDVLVGLGSLPQDGVAGEGFDLPVPAVPGERIRLTVQVAADGFGFPEGIRRTVLVDPEDLDAATTSLVLTAPATDRPRAGLLQVDYLVDDQPVGRAWRQLLVVPASASSVAPGGGPAPAAGQTPVHLDPPVPIDLTVTVLHGDHDDTLLWLFASPHAGDDGPLRLPDHQVTTRLPTDDAKAFALQQVAHVEQAPRALVEQRLRGLGRAVAAALPDELWPVLRGVWRTTRDESGVAPSVLFAVSEPWVPWELASVEERFLGDATLLDAAAPAFLGCQTRVGRWVPPSLDRSADPRSSAAATDAAPLRFPLFPPGHELGLHAMAVIVGDYGDPMDTLAALPEARAEGDHLVSAYPAVRVAADIEPVLALLNDELELPDGLDGPVDVVHIACHGKIDPVDPKRNGIVLSDDVARLDELTVRGGTMVAGQPLVFLNACQLATSSTELLGDQGGLAAAFLSIGARGFVAPLWSVEDTVARSIAEDFHRDCLRDGIAVGEAIRRARSRYAADPTSSTPLAYVYYGHPDLVLAAG